MSLRRCGWQKKIEQAKQAADLHTSTFIQLLVYQVIKDGFLTEHVVTVREAYRRQCDVMLKALQNYFPESAAWSRPQGGMFTWVSLAQHINTTSLLQQALENNIAFVPGATFYANRPEENTMRLSYVSLQPEKIDEGIARLGNLIKQQ